MSGLSGLRILVVEDEFWVAQDMARTLAAAGAEVIGPTGSIDQAMRLMDESPRLDAAVLDINLAGEMVFSLADDMAKRGIPFVFTTGYDADSISEPHRDVPRIEKPTDPEKVIRALMFAASSGNAVA